MPQGQRVALPSRTRSYTAAPRCLVYAACSELLASPHDLDPRASLAARTGQFTALPYAAALAALAEEYGAMELPALRREYSALFEVGNSGPPVPIRESVRPGRAASTRAEVTRFYEHFGCPVEERFAWQQDHLAVELEFVHFLCFRESGCADDAAALPYQLAQLDFCTRHPADWLPALAADAQRLAPGSLYARLAGCVAQFTAADLAWQRSTLST